MATALVGSSMGVALRYIQTCGVTAVTGVTGLAAVICFVASRIGCHAIFYLPNMGLYFCEILNCFFCSKIILESDAFHVFQTFQKRLFID